MTPPMSRMGTKTAISEMLIETTVKPTSRAPSNAASNGATPSSMCRDTFSRTTTASSTTKPVATVRAMSDRLSRLYPARYMMPKVPMSETGTATAGMTAARHWRRKRKTTMITRETEMMSVRSTSRREARMVVVLSETTWRLIELGIDACSMGRIAFTRSTVSITFAPG